MKQNLIPGLLAVVASCAPQSENRKNVILILADDIGYECIGAYGSTYSTPNLDAMASEGILYTHCYSQPLSTPTRVQLMTGQYNFRNYVEFGYMNPDDPTIGNVAQNAGYATCMIGKWQLGASAQLPHQFGFDEYCLWQLEKGIKQNAHDRYANVTVECSTAEYEKSIDVYGPDVFCDYALSFIERKKDEPFFIYYTDVLVHNPFLPTPDSDSWGDVSGRLKNNLENFPDMVSYMDKNIGRIVAKLKELDLYDDTVIIYLGDNGTHPSVYTPMRDGSVIRGGKGLMTDAGTHAPMVVHYPSGPVGAVSDALVDLTDFLPTIADITGFKIPRKWVLDGHSLLPQFRGDADAYEREWTFCHYDPLTAGIPRVEKSGRFIRTARYKLYHDGRFYDVEKDVLEQHPIAEGEGDAAAEEARAFLKAEMGKFPAWKPGDPGQPRRGGYDVANHLK